MKKSLIALAVMAAAGAASAQSSVTLFGIVDATLAWGHANTANKFQLTNSGYNSSRLGFRGTEDLGGGLSASFWLEAGMNNDDGTGAASSSTNQGIGAFNATTGANAAVRSGTQGLTFNRRSTVSLAGNWGEVRLGRDYTPQFWNLTIFDPFGTNGVGTNQILNSMITGVTAVRASNSVGYFLPASLGGLYGQVQYYAGENASNAANKNDGTGYAGRLGWASGPFNVAAAMSYTQYSAAVATGSGLVVPFQAPVGPTAATFGGVHQNNIAGQWDFGVAQLMAQYERDHNGFVKGTGYLIGGLVPVGPGTIRLAYSRYSADFGTGANPRSSKWALGYVHNLSKRTALYTTYAHLSNADFNENGLNGQGLNGSTTIGNGSSNGVDVGIRHSF